MLVISAWLIFHASRREPLHGDTSCSGVTARYSRWLQLGTGRSVPGSERFKLLWLCSNPFLNPLLKFSDNVLMAQSSNLPRNTLPYPMLSGWAHSFEICLFSVSKPDVWVLGESKNFWFFSPTKVTLEALCRLVALIVWKYQGLWGLDPEVLRWAVRTRVCALSFGERLYVR